jgi:hypothetical protein
MGERQIAESVMHEWRWTQNVVDGWMVYRCPICGPINVHPGDKLPAHIDGGVSP